MIPLARWLALVLLVCASVARADGRSSVRQALVVVTAPCLIAAGEPADDQPPMLRERAAPPVDDVRDGEAVRLVSTTLASHVRPGPDGPGRWTRPADHSRVSPGLAARWCDVTQCRRVGGVRLLGYATPPPRA